MSYSALLEEEGTPAQYLAILRPARRVEDFTLDAGSVYESSFDYGNAIAVKVNGTSLTLGTSSTLAAGEFYYDYDDQILYIRKSDSTAPSGSDWVIVTYEMYFGTFDAHWHVDPTDETSEPAYYEPLIVKSPTIRSSVKDLLFGFLPIQVSSLRLSNPEHLFERHLYDGSFFGREIRVYHWIGDLEEDNVQMVLKGTMGDISYEDTGISFQVKSGVDLFEKEFRSVSDAQFYTSALYPLLNPNFEGKPVRAVYGVVDGFVPVNLSYVGQNATTSDNRTWGVYGHNGTDSTVSTTTPLSPACTNTRTYLSSAQGFRVGDSVWINKTTDEYRRVTAVDYASNYIEHDALSSGAAASGDIVSRGALGWIDIVQGGIRYQAQFNRDWTEIPDANGVLTFVFSGSLESNLSLPNTLSPFDQVCCRVYGKQNDVTLGGPSFGTNNSETQTLTALPVILYDLLKRQVGLSESEINTASFTALLSAVPDSVGFAVPEQATSKYPKIKDLLTDLCKTGLIRLYQDEDLKWKVVTVTAISTAPITASNAEIVVDSFTYDFDTSDIYSDFVVSFGFQEVSESGGIARGYNLEKQSSDIATYLYNVSKTYEIKTSHIDRDEAAAYALKLRAIYGDRQGLLEISLPTSYFGTEIDDRVTIQREALPGFAYEEGTEQELKLAVVAVDKDLKSVKLTLTDLKGVNENSGDF